MWDGNLLSHHRRSRYVSLSENQCGMETDSLASLFGREFLVEREPMWDGNTKAIASSFIVSWLSENQCGMET